MLKSIDITEIVDLNAEIIHEQLLRGNYSKILSRSGENIGFRTVLSDVLELRKEIFSNKTGRISRSIGKYDSGIFGKVSSNKRVINNLHEIIKYKIDKIASKDKELNELLQSRIVKNQKMYDIFCNTIDLRKKFWNFR